MNRRSFFRLFGAGAATLALSEAIPFGRVWSFPSKIVVPEGNYFLTSEYVMRELLRIYAMKIDYLLSRDAELFDREFGKPLPVTQLTPIRIPRQYSARVTDSGLLLPA